MASKVLVPAAPYVKIQPAKKSPVDSPSSGPGFIISGDPAARAAHLEASIRFLQEQHRNTLIALHWEIEQLANANRDLQFQLIFTKEAPKLTPGPDAPNVQELLMKIAKLELETAAARCDARAAEARALQLQRVVESQAEKLRSVESPGSPAATAGAGAVESRAELRARLSDAERLVRRLRADGDRQRREVQPGGGGGGGVTNLLFDRAAPPPHLQCMKSSLQQSLRGGTLEPGFGFHNSYHFPMAEFWREPLAEEFNCGGGGRARRPLTLPELAATGQQISRSTIYVNHHTRPRANGYDSKPRKTQYVNNENINMKSPEEQSVSSQGGGGGGGGSVGGAGGGGGAEGSRRTRRHHRKHQPEHT